MFNRAKTLIKKAFKRPSVQQQNTQEETIQRHIALIRNSKLFDADFYLRSNVDVKAAQVDPATHYYNSGWTEGRLPCATFNVRAYVRETGTKINPVLHYELYGEAEKINISKYLCSTMDTVMRQRFGEECEPLSLLRVNPTGNKRLNVIFNGFDKSCFFGGKATALIFAILYANTYGYGLRIIAQDPDRTILDEFITLFKLKAPASVEYYAKDSGPALEISDDDLFLSTIWCCEYSLRHSLGFYGKSAYIMQEVETFFYDHGDTHLRVFNTLTDKNVVPVVNSKLLYDYLCAHGYENVKQCGTYFEPVFSQELFTPAAQPAENINNKKYKLFFYGRPSHQRNLFYFGLDVINQAFLRGILNPEEWVVYVAGDQSVPDIVFDSPVTVEKLGVMSWVDYCRFMATVDLCYSTIYTPHPSYPPLDAVTAGAVAVTNKYENKQDLSFYSKNIVMGDLTLDGMLNAIGKAEKLVKNTALREQNRKEANTVGTWEKAFEKSIAFLHGKLENQNV